MGDVSIIMGIVITLILMGVFLPYLEAEMGESSWSYNMTIFEEYDPDVNETQFTSWYGWTAPGSTTMAMFRGLIKAFLTTWSWFPIWLKGIHYGVRLICILLIWRQLRSGGG